MSAKSEVIGRLEAAHDEFRAKIAGLPVEAYNEVWLGTWNLSEVLAHMAGWFREMAGGFERVGRGERPVPEGVDYSDADAWNAKFSALAKPGKAALVDWDEAYAAYLGGARALSEDLYGVDPEKGRPRIGDRLLQGAGIGHFEEHAPDLDAWLKSRA
jgi:hypothetical protein